MKITAIEAAQISATMEREINQIYGFIRKAAKKKLQWGTQIFGVRDASAIETLKQDGFQISEIENRAPQGETRLSFKVSWRYAKELQPKAEYIPCPTPMEIIEMLIRNNSERRIKIPKPGTAIRRNNKLSIHGSDIEIEILGLDDNGNLDAIIKENTDQ